MKGVPFLCPHPESVNHSTLFLSVKNNASDLQSLPFNATTKTGLGRQISRSAFSNSLFLLSTTHLFRAWGQRRAIEVGFSPAAIWHRRPQPLSLCNRKVLIQRTETTYSAGRGPALPALPTKMICPGLILQIRKQTNNRLNKNELTVVSVVRLPLVGHVQICFIPLGRSLLPLHTLICDMEIK